MEILKVYYTTILYYSGKANVVGNTLITRSGSMGILDYLKPTRQTWDKEIKNLGNSFLRLEVS